MLQKWGKDAKLVWKPWAFCDDDPLELSVYVVHSLLRFNAYCTALRDVEAHVEIMQFTRNAYRRAKQMYVSRLGDID